MSLNRTLVGVAGAVLAGLGADKAAFLRLPYECQQAITNNLSDVQIARVCPEGFNDGSLISIILLGGGAFLLITFGREIYQFVSEKLGSDTS
jgi:hypothetical protein